MPNYTSNYNLELPLASEDYDISVVNANNEVIDTALHTNAENIAAQAALHPTGIKFTDDGGIAIQLVNNTGAVSVKGTVVSLDTVDNSFKKQSNEFDSVGAVLENGIANGQLCWVVYTGKAYVLLEDSTAATAGNWVIASTVDGRANATQPTPTPNTTTNEHTIHFKEIGHCLETKLAGTDVLCKIMMHFN